MQQEPPGTWEPCNPCPSHLLQFTDFALGAAGHDDLYIMRVHANGLVLLLLGPGHPLRPLARREGVFTLRYSAEALSAVSEISGRRKRGSQMLQLGAPFLTVCTRAGRELSLPVPIRARVLELNSALQKNPEATLLAKGESASARAFLAIFAPRWQDLCRYESVGRLLQHRGVPADKMSPEEHQAARKGASSAGEEAPIPLEPAAAEDFCRSSLFLTLGPEWERLDPDAPKPLEVVS